MNQMWGEMSERCREEYKQFFLSYHDRVARWGKKMIIIKRDENNDEIKTGLDSLVNA